MKTKKSAIWVPEQWCNAYDLEVSYKWNYKSGSTTIVSLLGNHKRELKPAFEKRFTVIREPVERVLSIYKETKAQRPKHTPGFSDWLELILSEGFIDKHQFPQAFWMPKEEIKVFRLDQLPDLVNWLGIDKEIPQLNKRTEEIYLSQYDLKVIKQIYHEDFELYAKYV